VRCDANQDGRVDIADAVSTLERLFTQGESDACRAAEDCDADGSVNVTDALYTIEYRFLGGMSPPQPFPDCGGPVFEFDECPGGARACLP